MKVDIIQKNKNAFCKLCKFHSLNIEVGLICNLTNDKPDFQDYCNNFLLDDPERQDRVSNIKSEIQDNINKRSKEKSNIFSLATDELEFLVYETLPIKTRLLKGEYILDEPIIFKNTKLKKGIYLFGGIIILGIVYSMKDSSLYDSKITWIIIIGLLSLIGFFSIYNFFERKNVFHISKYGVMLNEYDFIPWIELIFINFETIYDNDNYGTQMIVFHRFDGKKFKVAIGELDVKKDKLGELFYGYFNETINSTQQHL